MLTISIAIQKGGSGKTTTAINLAAALRDLGHRVLLVDLDPQANLTQALGIEVDKDEESNLPQQNTYSLLKKESMGEDFDFAKAIIETESGLKLLPSSLELASAELELVSIYGREQLLSNVLEGIDEEYDFVFIDCPPAIGMLTINALVASDFVLMPLQAEFLPLKGVKSFMSAFERVKKQLNAKLNILGFVLTRYDRRKNMNRQVLDQLEQTYGEKVFHTRIRTNIALAGSQEAGIDIFSFDQRSNGAADYMELATEFLQKIKS